VPVDALHSEIVQVWKTATCVVQVQLVEHFHEGGGCYSLHHVLLEAYVFEAEPQVGVLVVAVDVDQVLEGAHHPVLPLQFYFWIVLVFSKILSVHIKFDEVLAVDAICILFQDLQLVVEAEPDFLTAELLFLRYLDGG